MAARVTATKDLLEGGFVAFKTKLSICKNLGFASEFAEVFDRMNTIRNRYSHRRKYKLEDSRLVSLRDAVDALPSPYPLVPCEKFEIYLEGQDPKERANNSPTRGRLLIRRSVWLWSR